MKLNHIFITRFVAAISVVIYHYGLGVQPFDQGFLHDIFRFGNESVNYFFFLSGFIMIVAYYKPEAIDNTLDKKKFLINRFARIYPVYLLSLVLIGAYYILIDPSIFSSFGIRFLLESVLIQSWVGKPSLNYPGWSLSVEFFFYLTFPFLLAFLKQKKIRILLTAAAVVYVLNQAVYFFLTDRIADESQLQLSLNFFPGLHLATFLCGMTAGIIFLRKRQLLIAYPLVTKIFGYGFALLYLSGCVFLLEFEQYHHNGLLVPAYFAFIIAFSIESKWTKVLSNRLFVYLGDISYSLYILQFPVWMFFNYVTVSLITDKTVSFYLYLGVLIAISALTYSFFERTAQSSIKARYAGR